MIRTLRRLVRPFWNPIVEKELRSRMRTGRASILISLYLLTLSAVGYLTYTLVRRQAYGDAANGQLSVHAGLTIFRALTVWEFVLIVFITPALTSAAIAGERQRQTLDLLLVTRVRPASIIMGKLVASLLFALLLLVASVPVFSTVLLFGGVELSQVVGVAGILGVTAVVIGALGLLCSVVLPRPTGASASSYMVAFLFLVVPAVTSFLFPTLVTSRTVQSYAEHANPVFVLVSTLVNTPVRSPFAHQQVNGGPGGVTNCTVTQFGSSCSSSSSGTLTQPAPIPNRDVVVAGVFAGWRSWQAFAALNAVVVAVVFGLTVALFTRRHARGAYRWRRRASPPAAAPGPAPEPLPVGAAADTAEGPGP